MKKLEKRTIIKGVDGRESGAEEKQDTSIEEQVRREFEHAAELGGPERQQVENELAEPDYILPSPTHSLNDTKFKNITADQKGRAFGVENQRDEPLDILGKIEKRDKDRWSLNPESAETDLQRPDDE